MDKKTKDLVVEEVGGIQLNLVDYAHQDLKPKVEVSQREIKGFFISLSSKTELIAFCDQRRAFAAFNIT